jgi:SAM-dependent methyltransferase
MAGHAIGTHEAALRLALGVDELPDPRHDLRLARSRPFAGQRILDLACGPNPWPWVAGGPEYIYMRGEKVTVDLPGVRLPRENRALWSDRHVQSDIECAENRWLLDVATQRYHVIVALEIIEHIENPWQLLRRIEGCMEPGGFAVISTPNVDHAAARAGFARTGTFPWFPDEFGADGLGHITPIFPYIFAEMVRRAGLRIAGSAYNEPPPHWIEQASQAEQDGIAQTVRVWRLERDE